MSRLRDVLERVPENISDRVMPLGKHKGTLMKDLPADYVRWLADPVRAQPVPEKNFRGFRPELIAWAQQRLRELDHAREAETFASRCLGGHPTGYAQPIYVIETKGDCYSASGSYATDLKWFDTMPAALDFLSSEFPIELAENFDGERAMCRSTPDPEDDQIVIWEVLPSGHRKAVWGFFGWHFTSNAANYACGQSALPGDAADLYTIACRDL